MERRGFLSFLGAAVGGLFVPDIPKRLIIEPAKMSLPIPTGYDLVTAEGITRALQIEFEREFERMCKFKPIMGVNSDRIGKGCMEHQLSVAWDYSIGENRDVLERVIKPSASLLARSAAHKDINTFGILELPNGGAKGVLVTSPMSSIRLVEQYSVFTDQCSFRFDVIGGRT